MSEKLPDGWKRHELSEIVNIQMGYAFKSKEFTHTGTMLIRMGNLYKNIFSPERNPVFLPESYLIEYANYLVKEGDLVMSMTGTLGKRDYGFVVKIPESTPPCLINQRVIRLTNRECVEKNYLFYLLKSDFVLSKLYSFPGGTKQANLTQDQITSICVPTPSLPEQQIIARILSTWDAAIDCTQKLLENSRQQKKALMQQLLTGKKRLLGFFKKWNWYHIGDIAKSCGERNSIGKNLPVLACSKYAGFVDSLSYFKKQVFSEDTSTYKVIRRGEFGYPANHIEEGAIGYQNLYDVALVSPIYVIFKVKPGVNSDFLYRLLKTDAYRQIFSAATSASVDRRGSLRWPGFAKIKMYLPSVEEQTAIAEALSAADAVISQYEAKLANLQAQKKSLMQQLLTGKHRVKVDDVADTSAASAS